MAQFTAFHPHAKVAGDVVLALIDSIGEKRHEVEDILVAHGLHTTTHEGWYDMQNYLQALRLISQKLGPHWLFHLGKDVIAHGNIRAHNLDEALQRFDKLHQDDATSEQRYYRVLSYSEDRKEAHVECRNPYPCYFDRGVLTSLFRTCYGDKVQSVHVSLDNHRPSRLAGADVSYYTVMWQ